MFSIVTPSTICNTITEDHLAMINWRLIMNDLIQVNKYRIKIENMLNDRGYSTEDAVLATMEIWSEVEANNSTVRNLIKVFKKHSLTTLTGNY